ncbi:MAG: hypothetical protein K1X79_14395 [Oligoflexia bacterium]|nr:hypothetical protein [Oligoflexia bacterium]
MRRVILALALVGISAADDVYATSIRINSSNSKRFSSASISVKGRSVKLLCLQRNLAASKIAGLVDTRKIKLWRNLASLKGSKLKPYLRLRRSGLSHSQIVQFGTAACNMPAPELPSGGKEASPPSSGGLPFNPPTNPINAQLELSRVSGIAPLGVFANAAKLTTGLAGDDYLNPHYFVDWDSTGVDPTGIGNRESGFLSSHVYTKPGTYTVTMAVMDPLGSLAVAPSITVNVLSPNVEFMPPLGQTYCFSTTSAPDFSACPTQDPSKHIVTNNIASAISTYGGARRRLLLHSGDTWYENTITVPQAGPQSIGAYPNSTSNVGPAPRIISNGVTWQNIITADNTNDLRIAGLEIVGNFTGAATDPYLGGISMNLSHHALVFNNRIRNVNNIAIFTGEAEALIIANNAITDSGRYGIYGGANRLAISRNTITNLSAQMHAIRIQDSDNNPDEEAITDNTITNIGSLTAITTRGFNDGILISGNYVEKIVTFAPQSSNTAEFVKNVVFERNMQRPPSGAGSMGQAVGCTAENVVIRNNIWDTVGLAVGMPTHPMVPSCRKAFIYNNTYFNPTNVFQDEHHLIWAEAPVQDIWLFNNLYYSESSTNWGSAIHFAAPLSQLFSAKNMYYAPNQTSNWLQFNSAAGGGSLAAWQALGQDILSINANPQFESTSPTSSSFLMPGAGSPAVDSAINIAVAMDYTNTMRLRNGGFLVDIGARER